MFGWFWRKFGRDRKVLDLLAIWDIDKTGPYSQALHSTATLNVTNAI